MTGSICEVYCIPVLLHTSKYLSVDACNNVLLLHPGRHLAGPFGSPSAFVPVFPAPLLATTISNRIGITDTCTRGDTDPSDDATRSAVEQIQRSTCQDA